MSEPVNLSIEGITTPAQIKKMIAALHYHDRLVEALRDTIALARSVMDGERCDHGAGICWRSEREVLNAARALLAEIEEASR